ncbi:glutathione-dependent formaldehyde dehydrogenase [Tistrella bauzanensis]|uniref:Glutathione-dependent formaldehyde dehydrogenase n=1 Tax=Tistrella bauzanensis TaxID=657419 RepID=A0ABQ1I979_9PROT|nr:zinc-dependent alcohol dehydrogenase [Tistrella bauzanensis]GGB28059.1 glutathione-dependent formaldehyde dehydrogenase [Tistrella bauzanensis]
MKAVVFHDIGDIRLDEVAEPSLRSPTDAIVRITTSAICGTDLHMVRGTMPGMKPGTILGHEGIGIVEELGADVRNLKVGDRVVIPSTIGCGWCAYCRSGYLAQCDTANPNGPQAGTAFFGGPEQTGPFDGLQADYARVPHANVGLMRLPDGISDDQAIMLSDIFPTGYFGADIAEITEGDTVAVFGCGPVGQFAIISARLLGAERVIAVDRLPDRLEAARAQGAEIVNFEEEDPVEAIRALTGGIGADRVIDAVGVDAAAPGSPPGADSTQVLDWAIPAMAKAGTLAIIGVYPPQIRTFPIGQAMNRNVTINMGNCNHRRYLPRLIDLVQSGAVDPAKVLTRHRPILSAIDAYKAFDSQGDGWLKVALTPGTGAASGGDGSPGR